MKRISVVGRFILLIATILLLIGSLQAAGEPKLKILSAHGEEVVILSPGELDESLEFRSDTSPSHNVKMVLIGNDLHSGPIDTGAYSPQPDQQPNRK